MIEELGAGGVGEAELIGAAPASRQGRTPAPIRAAMP